jgi:site-specific DNA recombinase
MYHQGMAPRRSTKPAAPAPETAPRAAIYKRLSRYVTGETSFARQDADARGLAAVKGLEVVEVYEDMDLSAFKKGVVRPSYERLLDDVRAGAIDVIICWKVDRVARSLREFMRFVDILDEHGVALVSVNESLDTASPMGRAMLQILGVFAELESATISLRTKSAKAYSARAGKPNGGGRRAFGYADQQFSALVPEEVELLHEARDRLLAGESLRAIAIDWNRRQIRTAGGSAWSSSNLGRTLRSPHLAGKRCHNGSAPVDGAWPVVFTEEEYDAMVAAAGEHRPALVERHLLTGLVRCGACGGAMRAKTTRRAGFQYACGSPTCGRVVVNGAAVEELVSEGALLQLSKPKVRAAVAAQGRSKASKRLLAQLEGDRAALDQLSRDHYVDRVISREVFLASAADLEDRIADLDARCGRDKPGVEVPATAEGVRARWNQGTPEARLEYRRALLDALAEHFTVLPVGKGGGGGVMTAERVAKRVKPGWRY